MEEQTEHISSYGKVYAVGNKWVSDVTFGDIVVQEKIDGSQFSFCKGENGITLFRSRNCQMDNNVYEGMFEVGVKAIHELHDILHPNYIYRGEYLKSPKHHTVKYETTPPNYVILFDIELRDQPQTFLSWQEVQHEAIRLGLEVVPTYFQGTIKSTDELLAFLDKKPFLGGENIEGIVLKNYACPGADSKVLKAKMVRADFQEKQSSEWKKQNPTAGDVITEIINSLATPARWNKSIQHLEERGELQNAPEDIGPLMKEISSDVLEEEQEWIKEQLFKYYWKQISKGLTKEFPQWYKRKLMGFEEE